MQSYVDCLNPKGTLLWVVFMNKTSLDASCTEKVWNMLKVTKEQLGFTKIRKLGKNPILDDIRKSSDII
jgi:hypothetical protein